MRIFKLVIYRYIILTSMFTLGLLSLGIQVSGQDSLTSKEWVALPILYYTPETSLAFGMGSILSFYPKGTSNEFKNRASFLQAGLLYTLEQQLLTYFSWNIYNPEKKWELAGELGYYKFSYDYWGIGNQTNAEYVESYGISYPRLRLNPKWLITDRLGLGLALNLDYYYNIDLAEGGKLNLENVAGIEGGFVNGIGLNLSYDSRDHTTFPLSGLFLNAKGVNYDKFLGSEYDFSSLELDFRYFKTVQYSWIWASQLFVQLNNGNIPFYNLALLGGAKNMRGYLKGRYRDDNAWTVQTEMRIPVWKRFFIVPFIALGDVFSEGSNSHIKWAGGGGLRYTVKQDKRINIRLDAGYGESFQFYFSILEAF
ncbi:BamA/TamA family outer membrane protein [Membranihabitans marinus]|uniref:BamA/TamA family outer membrane protein n=1 Tax=Membranihabitans marinus TaxID=1227546 RepID=UPI001F030E77|nr:BamA/TamA family outer membrane protein [Membranihabitans marinus]